MRVMESKLEDAIFSLIEYRGYLYVSRDDIKTDLKILLAGNDYPSIDRDEVYLEIFELAENFTKYQMA